MQSQPSVMYQYLQRTTAEFVTSLLNPPRTADKSHQYTCTASATLKDVITKLSSLKIQRLFVTNPDGKLTGAISAADVLDVLLGQVSASQVAVR